ncbi:MAG: hypothetical protein V1876_01660 [Candidatus Peregrinibacteria bacterium]
MDDTTPLPAGRPGDEARAETHALRIAREKTALVEQLKKIPIVQIACEKVGISRGSFYNWKRDDPAFATAVDEAIGDGTGFVNDMAESQLLTAIKDGNLGAVTYWLKHRHAAYSNRMEVTAKIKTEDKLTPEQEQAIEEALRLTSFDETPPTSISIPPLSYGSDQDSVTSNTRADPAEHPALG